MIYSNHILAKITNFFTYLNATNLSDYNQYAKRPIQAYLTPPPPNASVLKDSRHVCYNVCMLKYPREACFLYMTTYIPLTNLAMPSYFMLACINDSCHVYHACNSSVLHMPSKSTPTSHPCSLFHMLSVFTLTHAYSCSLSVYVHFFFIHVLYVYFSCMHASQSNPFFIESHK